MRVPRAAFLVGLLLHVRVRRCAWGRLRPAAPSGGPGGVRPAALRGGRRESPDRQLLDARPPAARARVSRPHRDRAGGRRAGRPRSGRRPSTSSSPWNGDSGSTEKSISIRRPAKRSRRCCVAMSPVRSSSRSGLWAVLNGRRPPSTPTRPRLPRRAKPSPREAARSIEAPSSPVPAGPPAGPAAVDRDAAGPSVTRTASAEPTFTPTATAVPPSATPVPADTPTRMPTFTPTFTAIPPSATATPTQTPTHAEQNPDSAVGDRRADPDSDATPTRTPDSAVGDRGADAHPDPDPDADANADAERQRLFLPRQRPRPFRPIPRHARRHGRRSRPRRPLRPPTRRRARGRRFLPRRPACPRGHRGARAPPERRRVSAAEVVPSDRLDSPPRPVLTRNPVYPPDDLKARIRGVVVLRVLVSQKGEPVDIVVLERARGRLTEAAVEAVRQWRFDPALQRGRAVRAWTVVRVPFEAIPFAEPTPTPTRPEEGGD